MDSLMDEDLTAAIGEKIVSSQRAWQGDFLTVDCVHVLLPDDSPATRDVVRHPGAVGIVALDSQGRMLLVRQYRAALERITAEIPAGKLEAGEDPLECAARELAEETGYRAGRIEYLSPIAIASGYSDEMLHLFMATDLVAGEANPDQDEFVVSEWADLSDLMSLVLNGRIEDSKTVIAILLCDAMKRRV